MTKIRNHAMIASRFTSRTGLLALAMAGWLPAACTVASHDAETATSQAAVHGAETPPSGTSPRLHGQALKLASELDRLSPAIEPGGTCRSVPPPPLVCHQVVCNPADQAWDQVPSPAGTPCSADGRCDEHQNCVVSPTHLSYFGGKVVQHANVVKVLYGSGTYIPEVAATTGTNMATAYGQMMSSGVFDWLDEYNTTSPVQTIGRGSFGGSFSIAPAASHNGASITDASIQAELTAKINVGVLPAPTDDAVYMVHFPAGKSITSPDGTKSCVPSGFCAYHGTFQIGSQNVYYGVLPDLTGGCSGGCGAAPTTFQNQQSVASHELIETITDAEVGLTTTVGFPLAWYDPNHGEIGDICNAQQGTFVGTDGATYTIQQEFSNQEGRCITTREPQPLGEDEKLDLNNDGIADVCARGSNGVSCAVSTGASFTGSHLWTSDFSDVQQWDQRRYYSSIRFPDVNHDGRADICGRGAAGIFCAINNGNGFDHATQWSAAPDFSDGAGWGAGPEFYATIRFPDLNNDGFADVCGRGSAGVFCALNTGSGSFGPATRWETRFSDANQFNVGPEFYSTIRFPDLNNDGRADVCGRGRLGVYCEINTGSGFQSSGSGLWTMSFSDTDHWNVGPEYYSTIQYPDLNNDGRADICGRGVAGVACAINMGASFSSATTWETTFSDVMQFNLGAEYYSTIRFPDLNNDGRADVCGRGRTGVFCELGTGSSFGGVSTWTTSFSDTDHWNAGPEYYSTIRFPDVNHDGRADICGRGVAGIFCATSTGASFAPATKWDTTFDDAHLWNQGPQYYGTMRF